MLRLLFISCVCLITSNHLVAQCAITGQTTLVKCAGQSYNLGTGITVTGTTGAIQYSWNGSPPAATPAKTVSPSVTTTYTLQITDALGCTASFSVTIDVLPAPIVDAGLDHTICHGSSYSLCGTASSANGAITLYNWISIGAGQCRTVSPTTQTSYTLYAIDAAGCAATNEVTIFVSPLPTVSAGNDITVCLTEGVQTLVGSPAGGTWSGSGINASGQFNPTAVGAFNCTYTYTDANNCSNSDVAIVNVISPSSVNGGPDLELCLNSAALQLPAVGTWSGSASITAAGVFTPNAVGTHHLTVTSNAGSCSATDQVTIVVMPLPVINTGGLISVCNGQCAQLNANASSANGAIQQYQWTGGTVTNPSIANPTACPTTNTTYTVAVTDAKGCTVSTIQTVSVSALPVVNAGNDLTLCANSGAVQLMGASPAGGSWSGTGVTPSGLFTPITPGDFLITYSYTSGANCTNTATRNIHVVDPAGIDAGNDIEICLNAPAIQLTGIGSWSGSALVTSSGLFTPSSIGTHQLTYTEVIGQCQSSDILQVNVLPLPNVNAGGDQSACEGDVVNLLGSASSVNGTVTNYLWNQPIVANPTAAATSFTAATTLILQLKATDIKGCSATHAITVNVFTIGTVDAGNDMTVCTNEGAVTLTGQSPAGGSWSGTGVTAAGVFTPTGIGNYTLTYTYINAHGCDASDTRNIQVVDPSTVNVGTDVEVCMGTSPIQLLANGTWSGTSWVSSSGLFTPGATGTFVLNYSEQIGGCASAATKTITVLPNPEIDLVADTEVCVGEVVNITGTATSANGNMQLLNWQGPTAIQLNGYMDVLVVAQSTGSYSVIGTDVKGCQTTADIEITVYPLPTINAGNDITVCQNEETVVLSGASPAGGTWHGNGVTGSGVFTIGAGLDHTLYYTYTNAVGCSATDSLVVHVQTPQAPNVGSDINLCHNESPYQLPIGGSWTGSTWVTAGGLFTPGAVGNFELIYTEGQGTCVVTDTLLVNVFANPTVDAGDLFLICEGTTVQLNALATGGAGGYQYLWSHPELLNHPSFNNPILSTTSTITLSVVVTDTNQCTTEDDVTIEVVPFALPAMAIAEPHCVNSPIQLTNQSQYAVDYVWDFGNGTSSTLVNPAVVYSSPGSYIITLSAINAAGCTETVTETIEVIAPPVAQFSVNTQTGCSPLTLAISNESTGHDVQYSWNFGSSTSTDENPADVVFTALSTNVNYSIQLTASNVCGGTSDTESITVSPMPDADFDVHLSTQCSPITTQFTNSSSGNVTSYLWDFGDGETSGIAAPAPKIYTTDNTSSTYLVKLHAINQCGEDVEQMSITVMPNSIQSTVTPSLQSGCSPLFVDFSNSTTGATVHNYNFGDGQSSQLISPSHIFELPGDYEVQYLANDGCSFDTLTLNIHVDATPTVQVITSETSVCPNEEVTFNAQTTGDLMDIVWNLSGGVVSNQPVADFTAPNVAQCSPWALCLENHSQHASIYSWTMDQIALSNLAEPCHTFSNMTDIQQEVHLELRAENEFGCWDTASHFITVYPAPVADMTLEEYTNCLGEEVGASSNSTNDNYEYKWYVDASQVSTSANPYIVFQSTGNHLVKMVATNDFGCSVIDTATVLVHPTPFIDIMPSVFEGCPPLRVTFVNRSEDAVDYLWTFSNGQTSTLKQPTTVFSNSGNHLVALEATSEFGCVTAIAYDDLIEVFPLPKPSFVVEPDNDNDTFFDTTVPFTNTSQGSVSYQWDFGDGATSTQRQPTHKYRGGGEFLVVLTATNQHGCQNSFEELIKIDNSVYVYVPNAFTPDNDGINDVFKPVLSSYDEIYKYHFIITNKWGDKVFETSDPTLGWLGEVKGGDYYAPSDLYNWQLSIIFNQGQTRKQYKGEVILLR
jgi:PKD repeat protein